MTILLKTAMSPQLIACRIVEQPSSCSVYLGSPISKQASEQEYVTANEDDVEKTYHVAVDE